MDPMDYTMDTGQSTNSPSTASQCQYQQPHQAAHNTSSPFQPRHGRHYDPVHSNDGWYPPHNPNFQSRPSYAHPQMSWDSGPYVPIHGWQGFGEAHTAGPSEHGPSYRGPPGYMARPNIPWAQLQDHEQSIPFGYTPGTYPLGTPREQTSSRASARFSMASAATPQGASFIPQPHAERQRRADRLTGPVSNQTPENQRQLHGGAEPAVRSETLPENRAGRYFDPSVNIALNLTRVFSGTATRRVRRLPRAKI